MIADVRGLLDREKEAAALADALTGSAQGSGALVAVTGGVGMGRTALLDAAVHQARIDGITVLGTRGRYLERESPFALACRLFEPIVFELADAGMDALFASVCAAAARSSAAARLSAAAQPGAVAAADDARAGGDPASPAGSDALHRILDQMLARLTANRPVLVAVDDGQWADAPSLGWLAALSSRRTHTPVTLLASVCDGERCAEPALMDTFLAGATALRLTGLGVEATTALVERRLAAVPAPEFVTACVEATAGNPMLLHGLLDALAAAKTRPTAGAAGEIADIVLPTLTPIVHVRLRRVSPYAIAIAQAIAARRPSADLAGVADLTGLDLATVAEVAATLTRMGLLRRYDQTLRFAYPLLHNVVARDLTFAAPQAAHAHAARLLHASGAPDVCVAEHLLPTGPLGEPWATAALRAAASRTLDTGIPETAVAYLRRALTEPAVDDTRTALLVELGIAEAHVDVDTAVGHLTEALDRGATERRTDAVTHLADLLMLTGREEEAGMLLDVAGAGLADREIRLAELELDRVASAGAAVDRLDKALPSESPSQGVEPRLLSLLATRAARTGHSRADAAALARRALAAAPTGPRDARTRLRAVLALASTGPLGEAQEHCTGLIAAARRWQHWPSLAAAYSVRSSIAGQLGRLRAAEDDARAGLELFTGCGADLRAGTALECLAGLVRILIETGGHEEAAGLLRRADLTGDPPESWAGTMVLLARGRLAVATGDPVAGLADLMACGVRLAAMGVDNPAAVSWRGEAAVCLSRCGEGAKARRYAAEEVALARRWGALGPLGAALSAQAVVVGGRAGLAAHEAAVAVLKASPARLDLARCLVAYGTALRRARRRIAAQLVLCTAVDLAQQCSSPPLLAQARAELHASGFRRLSAASNGVTGLTESPRWIARWRP